MEKEVKKSPKANLESDRNVYFLMGVVLAIAIIFVVLEWTSEMVQMDERLIPTGPICMCGTEGHIPTIPRSFAW